MNVNELKLLTARELADILSLSVRTVWRLRSAGKLPKPLPIGANTRWRLSDVEKWVRLNCPDMNTFENLKQAEEK